MVGRFMRAAFFAAAALGSSTVPLLGQANLDDLVQRRGLYVEPESGSPFTGEVAAMWDAHTVRERGTLREGRWEGVHEWYHFGGQLATKETYKNGQLEGPTEAYYKNGQLSAREMYRAGRLDGPYESYWVRGWLAERGAWSDGEPCGEWVSFGRPLTYRDCPAQ